MGPQDTVQKTASARGARGPQLRRQPNRWRHSTAKTAARHVHSVHAPSSISNPTNCVTQRYATMVTRRRYHTHACTSLNAQRRQCVLRASGAAGCLPTRSHTALPHATRSTCASAPRRVRVGCAARQLVHCWCVCRTVLRGQRSCVWWCVMVCARVCGGDLGLCRCGPNCAGWRQGSQARAPVCFCVTPPCYHTRGCERGEGTIVEWGSQLIPRSANKIKLDGRTSEQRYSTHARSAVGWIAAVVTRHVPLPPRIHTLTHAGAYPRHHGGKHAPHVRAPAVDAPRQRTAQRCARRVASCRVHFHRIRGRWLGDSHCHVIHVQHAGTRRAGVCVRAA